ncbi:hypothetical protein V1477_003045 [Vespula maculifrons]|uniref:Uncharacterized protein n=1 Tax=Vespula maculifrons TaxID=7453 RepID=A0ABD2CTJ0_VESMC
MSFTEFGQDFNRLTTTCTAAAVLTPAESDYYDENGMLSDGVETAEGNRAMGVASSFVYIYIPFVTQYDYRDYSVGVTREDLKWTIPLNDFSHDKATTSNEKMEEVEREGRKRSHGEAINTARHLHLTSSDTETPGKRYKSPEDSPRSEQSKVRYNRLETLQNRLAPYLLGFKMGIISVARPVHMALLKLSHRILGKLIAITTFDIVLENESVALAKIVRRLEIREEDEF